MRDIRSFVPRLTRLAYFKFSLSSPELQPPIWNDKKLHESSNNYLTGDQIGKFFSYIVILPPFRLLCWSNFDKQCVKQIYFYNLDCINYYLPGWVKNCVSIRPGRVRKLYSLFERLFNKNCKIDLKTCNSVVCLWV